ncbi:hypothetical protein ACSBR2_004589 [Camellia fascicularis]
MIMFMKMVIGKKFPRLLHVFIVNVIVLLLYVKPVLGLSSRVEEDAKTRCIEREKQALLKFKETLIDDYGILSSWGSEEDKKDCCKWRGVGCNNHTGHVTMLDLHVSHNYSLPTYQALRGKISPSLLELQHLKYLDLHGNDFVDIHIPKFIGSLGKLQYLNLAYNGFSGPIPNQFRNLSNLQYLNLAYNFDVNCGNLEWISHLSLISHLDLTYVNLSKAVNWVQSINNLPLLEELRLSECSLPNITHLSLPFNSSVSLSIFDLSLNDLSSSIYSWLFNFSHSLTDVDLSVNQLKGPIPESFGDMIFLTNLSLGGNYLEGSLPKSFANLSHLQSLDLSENNLIEELHQFLKKLSGAEDSLQVLNMDYNRVSGPLPDFTRFSSLKVLSVGFNQLSGSIPETFGRHPNLASLMLYGNQISGSLPNLSTFPSLTHLDLEDNQLNGTMHVNIGQLSKLEYFDVSLNSLKGIISDTHFSNLSSLKFLSLSSNPLTFNFSSDWVPPFQLDIIMLSSCKLGPHFPKWLQTQNNFSQLDISSNGISDVVPSWFWDLSPGLIYLNLSCNLIKGLLPDLSLKYHGYPGIDLSSNHFMGPIPLVPPNVTDLNLSKNEFSGSLSFLCAIMGMRLTYLDLSNNLLSGEIPNCWVQFTRLSIISLAYNNLYGKIPSSMGSLGIYSLHLSNNNFSGEVPSSLKRCTKLRVIDLGGNKFTGKIPSWIGAHLTSLIVLSLRSNEFKGSIPRHICHLTKIQILDFSKNRLSGNIPHCFHNFTALAESKSSRAIIFSSYGTFEPFFARFTRYIENALVLWKGQESKYGNNLRLLKIIDLSGNELVGKIPKQVGSLAGLVSLNLSRNNLTGNIIQEVGWMKMLESLDLSANDLSGAIPTSLADLNFLSVLNLSHNRLSGRIPISTQLQSFDPSVYSGNLELCGLPLPNKCPGEEIVVEPPVLVRGKEKRIQEDDDKFVTTGFYVSLGLGFTLGFWTVFGTILFNKPSRHAYFEFLDRIKNWFYVTTALSMARLQRRLQR